MWTPDDNNALPTHEDINYAKKAICELENKLECTVDITEKAKITRELEIRKAWIAPMRKLPIEILSEIFIHYSKLDALGPVTITKVCHRWRQIILNIPGAWCLIYPNKLKASNTAQYVTTFFERSNPYLLHFQVPYYTFDEDFWENAPYPAELALLTSAHRLYCLKIGRLPKFPGLPQCTFSNLKRLSIGGSWQYHRLSDFSRSYLPRLEFLDFGRQTFLLPEWGEDIILPPLQYLSLGLDDTSTWCTVIKKCAGTLKTLKISSSRDFGRTRSPLNFQVTLPVIETFESGVNMNFLVTNGTLPIHIIAPKLRYYSDSVLSSVSHLLLSDLDQVIFLRTADISYIANYTALRELQLDMTLNQYRLANDLAEELRYPLTCPALCLIQMARRYEEWPAVHSLKRILTTARPGITLEFPLRMSSIPGAMEELSCPSDMPCQVEEPERDLFWYNP